MTGIPIIYFSGDFGACPTSRHHIAQELARHHPILWVESVATRNIDLKRGDLRRGLMKLKALRAGVRQLHKNIWVLTPTPLPFVRNALIAKLNHWVLIWRIRSAQRRLGLQRPILWLGYPQTSFAVGQFNERLIVYHATDEYADFAGVDREEVLQLERECLRKSDLTFFAVKPLYQEKRQYSRQSFLIPHGVDFQLFSKAQSEPYPQPPEFRNLQKPIIGFYGTVDERVDFDLLREIAENFPQASLVLIGKRDIPLNGLAGFPNVRCIPRKPKEELPKYCRYFDVAIIPYDPSHKRFETTNPIKLKEYLATGLPVVTYDFPDLSEKVQPCVSVAENRQDFILKLEDALKRGKEPDAITKRQDAVRGDSWQGIVGFIESKIAETLCDAP